MIEMVKGWHTNPKGQRRIPPTTLQASLYIIIALTHYTKENIDNVETCRDKLKGMGLDEWNMDIFIKGEFLTFVF